MRSTSLVNPLGAWRRKANLIVMQQSGLGHEMIGDIIKLLMEKS